MKLAVVCAWRAGEDDLAATLASAAKSAGKSATIISVEDKDRSGPARTRHRGIEAATDADVIIIIDAHMRFRGKALARMAAHVAEHGGLACPLVHHNPLCAFSGNYEVDTGKPFNISLGTRLANGKLGNIGDCANYYAGARIVYRAKDLGTRTALAGKWARDNKPGVRGCVMGACYAFRRDWYYRVGQPLAALVGWGCDEEALSIAAWMSGTAPVVLNERVAHRWRAKTPWPITSAEHAAVRASRMALIYAVVSEAGARRELEGWTRQGVPEGVPMCTSPEAERFRLALLALPRSWREWRAEVCEPDEIDGKQELGVVGAVDRALPPKPARLKPVANPVVAVHGIVCTHCKTVHDPFTLKVNHTYAKFRRHICPKCRNPFMTPIVATA